MQHVRVLRVKHLVDVSVPRVDTELVPERIQPLLVQIADGDDLSALNGLVSPGMSSGTRPAAQEGALEHPALPHVCWIGGAGKVPLRR